MTRPHPLGLREMVSDEPFPHSQETNLPQLVGPPIVIKAIKRHLKDFIGLPKAIPSSVISLVDLNGMSKKDKTDRNKAKELRLATLGSPEAPANTAVRSTHPSKP